MGVRDNADLSDGQKAIISQLQQQFVSDIGGIAQDPSSPAYLARWQTAQRVADDALRGLLGMQAYMGFQLHHYYTNFEQVILDAGVAPVTIDPSALAR